MVVGVDVFHDPSRRGSSIAAIISNTKAINESLGTLQKFETFMNNLISTNDNLLQSDRFMLKIIRLKFELETCLKSLRDILTS